MAAPFFSTGNSKMAIIAERKKYKITIEEIRSYDYDSIIDSLLEERHYTDEEIEKHHQYMRNGRDEKQFTKKVYGNKPSVATKEDKTTVLELIVDKIDLQKIINSTFEGNK